MKRIFLFLVLLLLTLTVFGCQLLADRGRGEPTFRPVSVTSTPSASEQVTETVAATPAVSKSARNETPDIVYTARQISNNTHSLEQVYLGLSLTTDLAGPYWELLSYSEVPWEQSTFELSVLTKDGQRFVIDPLERDFENNHTKASLLLQPGQVMSSQIWLKPYLQHLDAGDFALLEEAFQRNELQCEVKIRTRIAVPQSGEEVRFARVEPAVQCSLYSIER